MGMPHLGRHSVSTNSPIEHSDLKSNKSETSFKKRRTNYFFSTGLAKVWQLVSLENTGAPPAVHTMKCKKKLQRLHAYLLPYLWL